MTTFKNKPTTLMLGIQKMADVALQVAKRKSKDPNDNITLSEWVNDAIDEKLARDKKK